MRRVAGGLALAWSSTLVVIGVLYLALMLFLGSQESGGDTSNCENPDHVDSPRCSTFRMLMTVPPLEVVVVNGFGVAAGIGLLRGRRWARPTVVTAFAILGPLVFAWPAIGNVVEWSWPDRLDAATLLAAFLPSAVCCAILGVGRRLSKGSFVLDPGI